MDKEQWDSLFLRLIMQTALPDPYYSTFENHSTYPNVNFHSISFFLQTAYTTMVSTTVCHIDIIREIIYVTQRLFVPCSSSPGNIPAVIMKNMQ